MDSADALLPASLLHEQCHVIHVHIKLFSNLNQVILDYLTVTVGKETAS